MIAPLKDNPALNPHWVTFWTRVRAAAEELRQLDAEQIDTESR